MSKEEFDKSLLFWQSKEYKKGEYYNEYKNVCKHLGFVVDGVFRIYRANEKTGEEKNMLFFSRGQFLASYKSFLNQTPCAYFTESMSESQVLYIHVDDLNRLYRTSHAWEHFGRLFTEHALNQLLDNTEGFLFHTPEERYQQLVDQHPDIFHTVPLYHIASYLGIQGPSLSRIRKRMAGRTGNI